MLVLAREGLEDVEESLHRLFFRTEELDVVEEQDVDFFAEERGEGLVGLVVRNVGNEFLDKVVRGDVKDFLTREALDDGVADCLEEVSFPESGIAVDEQGVERLSRAARDEGCGLQGVPVALPDDETVKRETLIELRVFEKLRFCRCFLGGFRQGSILGSGHEFQFVIRPSDAVDRARDLRIILVAEKARGQGSAHEDRHGLSLDPLDGSAAEKIFIDLGVPEIGLDDAEDAVPDVGQFVLHSRIRCLPEGDYRGFPHFGKRDFVEN